MSYKIDYFVNVNGTSRKGFITTSYQSMCDVFGPPIENSGDGKVSGEWIFSGDDGEVFTVYDWKLTGEYGLSVQEFRKLDSVELNIGGNANANHFINWLENTLKERK